MILGLEHLGLFSLFLFKCILVIEIMVGVAKSAGKIIRKLIVVATKDSNYRKIILAVKRVRCILSGSCYRVAFLSRMSPYLVLFILF